MAGQASWAGKPTIKGSSESLRMALLTFSLIGLQSVHMGDRDDLQVLSMCPPVPKIGAHKSADFTPYLLQLGLAKTQTSLVFIAPPLSGLIVQPIIGTISDSSTLRWGRRRPYMMVGSLMVAACFLTLGWASEIVGLVITDEARAKTAVETLAVFCIYAVDFAINAVQACCRSLIVDTLPIPEQHLGSAWGEMPFSEKHFVTDTEVLEASRMLGLGHLLGYVAGTLDLLKYFGHFLGDSQFKQLCIIAGAAIVFSNGITSYCVQERVLLSRPTDEKSSGAIHMLSDIIKTMLNLPRKISAVCWITFWAWIGWSPFFVYGTTWVGETYYRQDPSTAEELKTSTDVLGDIARKGSLALVLFSMIAFAGSIVLPWFVKPPEDEEKPPSNVFPQSHTTKDSFLKKYQPDIPMAWALTQLAFGASMILAPFSHSFRFATTLIAFCGIPWAMNGWAPLAIMGVEINKLGSSATDTQAYTRLSQDGVLEMNHLPTPNNLDNPAPPPPPPPASNHESTVPPTHHTDIDEDQPISSSPAGDMAGDMAGIYLGILNIFATIPQFIATAISWLAFSILEPGKSPELSQGDAGGAAEGDEAHQRIVRNGLSGTAVCLAVGAVCSFVAAWRSFALRKL